MVISFFQRWSRCGLFVLSLAVQPHHYSGAVPIICQESDCESKIFSGTDVVCTQNACAKATFARYEAVRSSVKCFADEGFHACKAATAEDFDSIACAGGDSCESFKAKDTNSINCMRENSCESFRAEHSAVKCTETSCKSIQMTRSEVICEDSACGDSAQFTFSSVLCLGEESCHGANFSPCSCCSGPGCRNAATKGVFDCLSNAGDFCTNTMESGAPCKEFPSRICEYTDAVVNKFKEKLSNNPNAPSSSTMTPRPSSRGPRPVTPPSHENDSLPPTKATNNPIPPNHENDSQRPTKEPSNPTPPNETFSKLEKVGIIVGIITAITGLIITIYLCAFGSCYENSEPMRRFRAFAQQCLPQPSTIQQLLGVNERPDGGRSQEMSPL